MTLGVQTGIRGVSGAGVRVSEWADGSASKAAARLKLYRERPWEMVRQEFGAEPDSWQMDALHEWVEHDRVAMLACVGPGKTAVLAWMGLNFLVTRPSPKVACTSITWANLRDNLWSEFNKWIQRSEFLREALVWGQMKISRVDDPNAWIVARTWDRSADPEQQAQTLAGLHADYIMCIGDETGGMPPVVITAAEGILSSCVEGKLVQAGNPIDTKGALHEATEGARKEGWRRIRITADPDDPKRAPRVDVNWAREQIELHGRDSLFVRTKILGLFPLQPTDAIVSRAMLEEARNRDQYFDPDTGDVVLLEEGFVVLGVDVARFGADKTVVCIRNGDFVVGYREWGNEPTDETAERVAKLVNEYRADYVVVDDIGVGGGVVDLLKRWQRQGEHAEHEIMQETRILGLNVAESSDATGSDGQPLYDSLKAELSMELREQRFLKQRIGIYEGVYVNTTLVEQATDVRYQYSASGKVFQIEPKKKYKERHDGKSPDHWDALVLAFYAQEFSASKYGWL